MNDRQPLEQFDLMAPATQACPYAFYERLRAEAPLYRMPNTGFWLVTTYELCREVMRQPDLFASGVSPMALKPSGVPQEVIDLYSNQGWLPTASCSTSDPPRHTWVRKLLDRLFTVSRVRTLVPMIERTAHELIDGFAARGECEFVRDFAHPLPMMVIADLIGVPRKDLARFKAWSDAIVEPFSMMISREREIECARLVVEMQHYFAALIEERRAEPREDLLTVMAQAHGADGEPIALCELLSIITIDLLASGNETTTAALASGLKLLIEDPEPIARVRREPRLLETLAEEVLRLESPAQGMFRRVTADTTLGGVPLREGELLSLRFGSANRDESQFPHAARIDLDRAHPGKHLALGIGRHHCIGAALARQELISAFGALLGRCGNFRLTPGSPPPEYVPSFFGRNLRELHVSFDPAQAQS
ncbi:MAG TPA: cytochrome P450 [Steroidobacteraceae bacterium]|nr:cytochrome P450 [Steroidobacteraceae bacterium]